MYFCVWGVCVGGCVGGVCVSWFVYLFVFPLETLRRSMDPKGLRFNQYDMNYHVKFSHN